MKPTTAAYALPARCVLWGSHPAYADGAVLRLHEGTQRQCQTAQRQRERDGGWTALGIYRAGDEPTGLRLQVAEATTPTSTEEIR